MAEEVKDLADELNDPVPPTEQNVPAPATEEPKGEQPTEAPAVNVAQPAPPAGEEKTVPYERFKEINEELKQAREREQRYLSLVEDKLKPPPPAQPVEPDDDILDPVVKQVRQENRQLRQVVGQMADRMDLIDAKSSIPNFAKHEADINAIRNAYAAKGVYVSREDAYTYLQGKQVLSRPASTPKPTPAPAPIPAPEATPTPIPATRAAASNKPAPRKDNEPGTPEYAEAHKNDLI